MIALLLWNKMFCCFCSIIHLRGYLMEGWTYVDCLVYFNYSVQMKGGLVVGLGQI